MISNINKKINDFLCGQIVSKECFDDFKNVATYTDFDLKIMTWFRFIQNYEIIGWRNKLVTKKICNILKKGQKLHFYSLFCPSYLKGNGAVGFRKDDVGNTTKNGILKLKEIVDETRKIGFLCDNPEAIFFDLALEQPDKTTKMIDDLYINIENFKKYIPKDMEFYMLSQKFPELKDIIGYFGIELSPLPVDDIILNRIIERGSKFYELFGWNKEMIIKRSKTIASSEAIVGTFIRYRMADAIMVYTPTMLERAQIYSGKKQNDPLPIIIPKK